MSTPDHNLVVKPDVEGAANLLQQQPEQIVCGIFQLLIAGRDEAPLQGGPTQAALKILNVVVENQHKMGCLKVEAAERTASQRQKPVLMGLAIVGITAVSYLFLEFNHPEFIVAVFTAAGGFAAGHATANHRTRKP